MQNFGSNNNNNNRKHHHKNRKPKNSASAKLFLIAVLILLSAFLAVVCYALSSTPDVLDESQSTSSSSTSESTTEQTTGSTDKTEAAEGTTAEGTTTPTTAASKVPPTPGVVKIDSDNWELTLVNTNYRLPEGFVPEKLLTVVNDCRLDSRVVPHYIDMYNAALKDGAKLTPFSGYRTYEVQERNYNNKINYYRGLGYDKSEAAVKAATVIMPPGSSEHNLGFAMDIVTCDTWFETTTEFTWLRENAYKYGFIMRYAKEKTDITGVIYEPWHWRYVGVKAATDIYQTRDASGVEICLEEYLGIN
ncbi:MAG TPA: M15 family metallopeptidase [Oscillospiraceae bacterium]|nr:M15 family metallopeptidase [Oscillospiraceae bacterium]